MNATHRGMLALGAAIGFGLAAIIELAVWAKVHQSEGLYVAIVFAVAALLWLGVSLKWRTSGKENR